MLTLIHTFYFFLSPIISVPPGFEAMRDQNICNKIMTKFIQNYNNIFENNTDKDLPTLIIVKVGPSGQLSFWFISYSTYTSKTYCLFQVIPIKQYIFFL